MPEPVEPEPVEPPMPEAVEPAPAGHENVPTVGVLVMAYGTPASADDLETYYTHIRRGRPATPEQVADLRARYDAIGGVSPLRQRTEAQRAAIGNALRRDHHDARFVTALGQKHAAPFIEDAVAELAAEGAEKVVGIVLAPHFSKASVGQYNDRANAACAEHGLPFTGIDSWADQPAWIATMADALADARANVPDGHQILFTAHSLPERVLADDPYPDELHTSASAIADHLDLPRFGTWALAWQSAGRTPEPWRGPDILDVLRDLAATNKCTGVVVCAQGFTSDHLEVLYDLDIEASTLATELGLAFARTRSLNDEPSVMAALADLIAERASTGRAAPLADAMPEIHPVSNLSAQGAGLGPGERQSSVVVIGGGVAGLTAAYTILRRAPTVSVTVIDAAPTLGGKLRTSDLDGVALDEGADAFLARVPEAVALCDELGLRDQLASPASGSAFLWIDGELRRLPPGLLLGVPTDLDALDQSGLLTPEGMACLRDGAAALSSGGDRLEEDTSVGQVVRAQLGDETFERLVAPLLGGVHAGDADRLSLHTGAPQIAAALAHPDGLLAGAQSSVRRASEAAGDGGRPPVFFGLTGGMSTLVDALRKAIVAAGGEIISGTPATGLSAAQLPGRPRPVYTVHLDLAHDVAQRTADAVVIATPAAVGSRLLESLAPPVAAELAAVRSASVVLVSLSLPANAIAHPLDGSGFLTIPRGYADADPDLLLTACSFATSKWAHLGDAARPGQVLLRVSAGKMGDARAFELNDDELIRRLFVDLQRMIGLDPRLDPKNDDVTVRITRWTDALPQFTPGHLDRVASSDAWLNHHHPGIAVVGASRIGLGVPACIVRAIHEADRLTGRLTNGLAALPTGPA